MNLDVVLGLEIAAAPCAVCHARSIMAGIAAGPQVALQGAAGPFAIPGSVTSAFQAVSDRADAAVASLEEAASAALETSLQAAANVSFSAEAPTPAAGAGAAAGGGDGDGGGGGGGDGGGGGGVPATVMTAQLMCSFGVAPSVLNVLPINRTTIGKQVRPTLWITIRY